MINKITKRLERICKDYKNIENYTEAVKSPLRYDLHHRLEIDEMQSRSDLIADNLYYDRPAAELIFLEQGEHTRLHNTNRSAETRQKLSISSKGKHPSAETRQTMSDALKGRLVSEDTRKKLSISSKGHEGYFRGKPSPWKGRHWHLENGKHVYTE